MGHRLIGFLAGCWPLGVIVPGSVAVGLQSPVCGLVAAFVFNSLVAMVAYAEDKFRANKNLWRIPERRLHIWELLGGWPGAVVAQQLFNHKHGKPSFQAIFWICVLLNAAAVYFIAKNSGAPETRARMERIRTAVVETLQGK